MNEICRSFQVEIEALTPVHVGSGATRLAYDYDFAVDRRQVWVIDQTKMLAQLSDDELERDIDARITHILGPAQFRDCSRYALNAPGGQTPHEIYPCVKDTADRPYMPGSTLKGAIRTALAWEHYAAAANLVDSMAGAPFPERRENRKFAGASMERRLFGPDPNHDLMRALSVADCAAMDARPALVAVSLLTLRDNSLVPKGPGFRFFLEAIPPGTRLTGSLRIDEYLLSPPASRAELADKRAWIEEHSQACRSFAEALLRREVEFYSQLRHRRAQQECERLRQASRALGPGQFLLQVGWGTGWGSKTVGSRLSEPALQAIVRRFDLDRGRRHGVFPKTRRLVEADGVPAVPPGWLKVTLKEESR